jgi:hypothetical protein
MNTLFSKYDDTFNGGQLFRQDVDDGYVILLTREPEDVSEDFLRGFRNPNGITEWKL